jgi:hypothetical protein
MDEDTYLSIEYQMIPVSSIEQGIAIGEERSAKALAQRAP